MQATTVYELLKALSEVTLVSYIGNIGKNTITKLNSILEALKQAQKELDNCVALDKHALKAYSCIDDAIDEVEVLIVAQPKPKTFEKPEDAVAYVLEKEKFLTMLRNRDSEAIYKSFVSYNKKYKASFEPK